MIDHPSRGSRTHSEQYTEASRARATARSAENRKNPDRVDHPATSSVEYSQEAIDLMKAAELWKSKTGRRYPSWSEMLTIMHGLGYEKSARDPMIPTGTPREG